MSIILKETAAAGPFFLISSLFSKKKQAPAAPMAHAKACLMSSKLIVAGDTANDLCRRVYSANA